MKMGLDNDIYTILNSGWVADTISKPTFHSNLDPPRAQTHHLYIKTSDDEKTIDYASNDLSLEQIISTFEIHGWENSEADCEKMIKMCKNLIVKSSLSNGYYTIKKFSIKEENQIKSYKIFGEKLQLVENDKI